MALPTTLSPSMVAPLAEGSTDTLVVLPELDDTLVSVAPYMSHIVVLMFVLVCNFSVKEAGRIFVVGVVCKGDAPFVWEVEKVDGNL